VKIQCLRCKEIVAIGPFVARADGIEVTCADCRESFFLATSGRETERETATAKSPSASASADASDASDEDDDGSSDACPKCGAMVPDDVGACKACGLLRDHFAGFASDAAADADPVLEGLWQSCEEDWENDDAHESFIARASSTGAYAMAARQYRIASRARPNDSKALARLDRITKMAEVAILSARPAQVEDEVPTAYRGVIALLVILLLIGVGAGIYALTKKSDTPAKRTPAGRR